MFRVCPTKTRSLIVLGAQELPLIKLSLSKVVSLKCVIKSGALCALVVLILCQALVIQTTADSSISDRLASGQSRRRQSQATLLSHKQNLITGSANTPLTSPYNQFYLTNSVNSPHNVISSLLTSPWITPLSIKETCTTASDNRAGICMPKKACLASGGYVAGTCGILGSCCVYQGTCRTIVAANETYFVSPAYPSMHKERLDPPICIFTLQRSPLYNKWPVCQFKLNFDEFSLAPPLNGTCGGKTDSFIVSGAVNFNTSGLPTAGLCGDMSGQHMYLDVDPERPDDPLLLIVNTANEQRYNRRWSIRVQQIACHSPFRAPNGCLQFHTAESGIVESFNYRGNGRASAFPGSSVLPIRSVPQYPTLQFISSPNYFNDLYYGVCIQKQARMCAIKWQAIHFDFGGTLAGLSDVSAPNSQTYGCVRNDGLALYGADLGDYVAIQGASRDGRFRLQSQFCGQRLNSLPQQDVNDEIITYAKPFTMIVRTDNLAGLHSLPQAPRSQKASNVLCYECDSRYEPNCADPFELPSLSLTEQQTLASQANNSLSPPGGINNNNNNIDQPQQQQATGETNGTQMMRPIKTMPRIAVCHGCCVKITSKTPEGAVYVKRTCTTSLSINFFMVGLVCMKESGDHGKMCFCETDYCNGQPPTSGRPTLSLLICLLLVAMLVTTTSPIR